MTGEAPVPEARETSVSFGSVRALGHVGFDVHRSAAVDSSHLVIALDFGRRIADDRHTAATNNPGVKKACLGEGNSEPGAAGTIAEAGKKVA